MCCHSYSPSLQLPLSTLDHLPNYLRSSSPSPGGALVSPPSPPAHVLFTCRPISTNLRGVRQAGLRPRDAQHPNTAMPGRRSSKFFEAYCGSLPGPPLGAISRKECRADRETKSN